MNHETAVSNAKDIADRILAPAARQNNKESRFSSEAIATLVGAWTSNARYRHRNARGGGKGGVLLEKDPLSREGTLTRRRTWLEGRQLLEGGACEGHSTAIRRSPLVTRRAAQRSAGLGPPSRARGIRQATRQTSDGWREKRCFGRHISATARRPAN